MLKRVRKLITEGMAMSQSIPLATRELYAPSHFGNTYEATLPGEMANLMAEARFWGFNRFSDWFDTIDLYNVYAKRHNLFNMPEAVWARKFANYECAAGQGLGLGLLVTPNHVFTDQVTPENEARKGDRLFGQLVCPSKPGVTDMILANYDRLFRDFTDRGLRIESLAAAAYDYGGCDCEQCRPWIIAFGKLFRQIAKLGRAHFGDQLQAELCGWWWTDEDHATMADWANAQAPGEFQAVAYHLPYGVTDYTVRPVPAGCAEKAFVHIAYGERSNRDSYCHYGVNLAPARLEKTIRFLAARGARGFMAYSEGDHDDVNKALVAGLGSGLYPSADAVLRAYADRYFGTDAAGWSELLHAMGDFESLDVSRCRSLFDSLTAGARPGWRLSQIEGRLKLAAAHQSVLAENEWNPRRMAAAAEFLAVKEHLYRQVWRLGLQRHAFRFETNLPGWHAAMTAQTGARAPGSHLEAHPEA
jgi:hypothetical protein